MRRRLACDYPDAELEHMRPGQMDQAAAAARAWIAHGSRVVMLDADAVEALASVPLAMSLPVARRAEIAAYVSPLEPGGFDLTPDLDLALVDIDGFWVCGEDDRTELSPVFLLAVVAHGRVRCFGPSRLDENRSYSPGREDAAAKRIEQIVSATVAALSDPLWLRKVVVRSETPTAPRRARKRGDPRAQPFDVLRLAPTRAPHVVRYRAPVVLATAPPTGRRRVGRGIVLGAPMPEHDVRGHLRRWRTTRARADANGWHIVQVLRSVDAEGRPVGAPIANPCDAVIALVPVRAHVRGTGPRRDVLLRGARGSPPP